ARFSSQHASDTEIEALTELVSEASVHLEDTATLRENNRKFHYLIGHSARNRYLLRSLSVMTATLSLLPTLPGLDERAATVQEHVAIARAISARDPEAAELAARAHVRSACRSRIRHQILEG